MLYIVSTPIGNLEDITLRALEILKNIDLILCEDTRHARILLKKYQIETPVMSYHGHSGLAKEEKISKLLQEQKSLALISDAGTPGISDPGYRVVQIALEQKVKVIPLPGPSAFLTALQASGLPIHRFAYWGFLPIKKGRQTFFQKLAVCEDTVVFYESPHRIEKTLLELEKYLDPERPVVLARELTKMYEEFIRCSVGELSQIAKTHKLKGEFVILVGGGKW